MAPLLANMDKILLLVWPSLKIPAEFITDKEGREIPHCNGLGEPLILKGYKTVKTHKVPRLFLLVIALVGNLDYSDIKT